MQAHFNTNQTQDINFSTPDGVILKISQEGFEFKGDLIEDAGEAHKAFLKVMAEMTSPKRGESP